MASSGKTPKLNLNQWSLNDKPQMEDVNRDNLLVDTAVSSHIEDMISHLSAEEHEKFTKRIMFVEYFGNNNTTKDFDFKTPLSFAIVFAVAHPLSETVGEKIASFFGMASNHAGSLGVSISGSTVTVKNASDPEPIYLNRAGVTYCIAAFS